MGIYAGDAPSLFEVNGHLLTYDEYEFWQFMGKPAPLQFARQLAARKRLQMSRQNMNKQTPRPPLPPDRQGRFESQHAPRRVRKVVIVYEGDAQTITHTRYEPEEDTQLVIGPTTRLVKHCRACADELPPDAVYCISCRTKV